MTRLSAGAMCYFNGDSVSAGILLRAGLVASFVISSISLGSFCSVDEISHSSKRYRPKRDSHASGNSCCMGIVGRGRAGATNGSRLRGYRRTCAWSRRRYHAVWVDRC